MAVVKRNPFEVFLILLCLGTANGNIVVEPSNIVVVAGNWMSMECHTTNGSRVYRWTLRRPNSSDDEFVFVNHDGIRALTQKYSSYFGVEMDESCSGSLYSNTTQLDDAGVYVCRAKVDGRQIPYGAHLIVLESEPFCETNNYTAEDNSTLTEGDIIWMRCKVNFRGIWSPTVEWKQHTENDKQDVDEEQIVIQGVSTEIVFNNRVTTTFTHVVDLSKTTYFSCRVFFQWHNVSVQVTTTNVPDYTYTWESPRLPSHRVELETTEETTVYAAPLPVEVRPLSSTTTKSADGKNNWYILSLILLFALMGFVSLLIGLGIRRRMRFRRNRELNMVYNASTSSTAPLRRLEEPLPIVYDIIPSATQNIYEGIDAAEEDDDDAAQAMTSCNGYPPLTECYSGLMAATGGATCQYDSLDQYDNMDLCDQETEDPTTKKMPGSPGPETEEERYTTPVTKRSLAIPNHPSGSSDYLLMVGNAKETKVGVKPLYVDITNNSDEENYPGKKVKAFYTKDCDDYLQPGPKTDN